MDAVRKGLGKVSGSGEHKSSSSSSSPLDLNGSGTGQSVGVSAALAPPHSSLVLSTRAPRQVVSYWACSKLCAIFFVAGVFFGYTLRGRVRRWASKVLKRLTDN